MADLESLLLLNMVEGLGVVRLRALLDRFGTPQNVLCASADRLQEVPGIGKTVSENIVRISEKVDLKRELQLIKRDNIKLVTVFDEDYPPNLKAIYDPPILLYVKGDILSQDIASVAIVGSRRATYYGRSTSENLSAELASRGMTIVSGMARGIDTASHKGALRAKGRTIAVLGNGIDIIYPPENKALAGQIASSGAVISEFPIGTIPNKQNFPMRNRVISGLSLGVIIVEAARYSGSLITADCALEQGREVFAVPGNARALNSQGTNRLIKQGARLVETADDVMEELEPILKNYSNTRSALAGSQSLPQRQLTADEGGIYDILTDRPLHIDEIIQQSRKPVSRVSGLLTTLEIKGLIKQLPGKMFVKRGL